MNHIKENSEYFNLIKDILENKNFNKLLDAKHHGISRFEHSMRVSYYSYRITKALGLDYIDAARGGLLHDFYFDKENKNFIETVKEAFIHPNKAVVTASDNFVLNDKQKDIIKSHMFPYSLYRMTVPKYAESWLVSLTDKTIATYEFSKSINYRLTNASNYLFLFVLFSLFKLR